MPLETDATIKCLTNENIYLFLLIGNFIYSLILTFDYKKMMLKEIQFYYIVFHYKYCMLKRLVWIVINHLYYFIIQWFVIYSLSLCTQQIVMLIALWNKLLNTRGIVDYSFKYSAITENNNKTRLIVNLRLKYW